MTVKRARLVFAVLMQAAREGKHLTQYDKQQLSVARQTLRQIRKPTSNPRFTKLERTNPTNFKHTQSIRAEHADAFIHNPKKGVLIYGQVNRIIATKVQKHICDLECKRHGHRYYHDFSSRPKMYGLPNGDILISSR